MVTADQPLPASADVVVVGGGVVGASIAFHLAEAGVDVLLLEREDLACGSSGKPIGGVRAQFSDRLNIELSARSLAAYADFAVRPGADIGLEQVGYLFLLRTDADAAAFAEAVALQNTLGVPSAMITPGQAHALCPWIDPGAFVAAAFSPTDGHARPEAVVRGYAAAAQRLGARVVTGCTVTGVDTAIDAGPTGDGARITAVRTSAGTVATSTVVCAAGAWSRQVGAMVGVDLPVHPLRRQIAFTAPLAPHPGGPARVPFTIDFSSSFYFHDAGDGLLLGMSDPAETAGFTTSYDEQWLPRLRAMAAACAPALADVDLPTGWAGLYELTPDHNAVIGEAPATSRFLYAAGFSGHGFLQAPAVGEVVRDLVLRRPPVVDVAPLRAERFAQAEAVPELHIV